MATETNDSMALQRAEPREKVAGEAVKEGDPGAMRKSSGFTFIEIMVVLAMLALMAGISVPLMDLLLAQHKEDATRAEMQRIEQAVVDYRDKLGDWPGTIDDLVPDFLSRGMWNEDYKYDSWNNPYKLIATTDELILYSYGRDETDDDHDETKDIVLTISKQPADRKDRDHRESILETGLLAYYSDCNQFPDSPGHSDCEHLQQLIANSFGQAFWRGPYVTDLTAVDICHDGYGGLWAYTLDEPGNLRPNAGLEDSRHNLTVVEGYTVLKAKIDYTRERLGAIELAKQAYIRNCNTIPPLLTDLIYSPTPGPQPSPTPCWSGPYLDPQILTSGDAWDQAPWLYRSPYVYSSGPNRIDESSPPAYGGDDVYL